MFRMASTTTRLIAAARPSLHSALTSNSLTKVASVRCQSSQAAQEMTASILTDIRLSPLEQPVFEQAVREVVTSLTPLFDKEPIYLSTLTTMCEPERMILFRVPWIDDSGVQRINRGYRVQFNNALGPYKGGLRFHPTVNLSIMKFLAFEQTFKNALTGLPIGSAKGGADFDPKGKSNREVFKFCRSFMTELCEFIGPDKDIPAGDIGVGAREIGYLYGQYKRITKQFQGVLTGKSPGWGGSFIRKEATGYGLIYIAEYQLAQKNETLKGKRCVISGSGNVAIYACEKLLELGAKVLTFSDSGGYVYQPDGFTHEQFEHIRHLKEVRRGRLSEYVGLSDSAQYFAGEKCWSVPCDVDYAFPCATQNELNDEDAKAIVASGCKGAYEGANMPTTNEGIDVFHNSPDFSYYPGKAANAGGVAVSCLEMAQNSGRLVWPPEKVDAKLKDVMVNIHKQCEHAAKELGQPGNYQLGANAAGFRKVANAMFETGIVFHADTY